MGTLGVLDDLVLSPATWTCCLGLGGSSVSRSSHCSNPFGASEALVGSKTTRFVHHLSLRGEVLHLGVNRPLRVLTRLQASPIYPDEVGEPSPHLADSGTSHATVCGCHLYIATRNFLHNVCVLRFPALILLLGSNFVGLILIRFLLDVFRHVSRPLGALVEGEDTGLRSR